MAADQRKKRVNASSSLVGCTPRNQFRVKRKRLEPLHHNLKMKPNISLEWDSKKNGVVSRRDQIGISQRHLIPFTEPVPHGHNVLVDVFSVPQEIFQFENLSEVLSYEVWQSHFSEKERSFLSQFLPKETDPDTVVHDLLDGNNFHFGNSFLDWGTSLCSGELHPDSVLQKEQSLKACKKAYHLNLQNYHNDMIENLETWKEKWVSCNDPEVDIVQKMWRKHARKILPPPETRFYGTEENHVATPESANSERAESQKRKKFMNKKSDSSSSGLKVVSIPKQGEKVHKRNIQSEDGAKYMSYIKVSKEQHERVKNSMKHTGNSIQPRSLNNVLGSIDALNVQPFERFEEEERDNLHIYWLKLSNRDIPEYFAAWKKKQLQRQQVTWSLAEEIREKLEQIKVTEEKEKECCSQDNVMEPSSEDDGVEETPPVVTNEEVDKEHQSDTLLEEDQMDDGEAIHKMMAAVEDEMEKKGDYICEEELPHDDTEAIEEDVQEDCNQQQMASLDHSPRRVSAMIKTPNPIFLEDQHQQPFPTCHSNNPHVVVNSVEMLSHCSSTSAEKTEGDESPQIVSEYHGNSGNVDISISQGGQGRSDVWAGATAAAGDVNHGSSSSYYQSCSSSAAANDGYTSSQELSPIGRPQLYFIQEEEPVQKQMLDLDSNRHIDVVHRESHDMSFFNPYSNNTTTTNQDRSELLQSLVKGGQNNVPRLLQARNEKMRLGLLQLQPGNDVMMEEEVGQFGRHHQSSLSLVDVMRQKRLNDVLYLQQQQQQQQQQCSIQGSSSSSTYTSSIQGGPTSQEGHRLAVNNSSVDDWARVCSSMSTPSSQPPQLTHNNNWLASSFEGGVSSNNVSDQTLYSVLSECNELRSAGGGTSSYHHSVGPTERLIQAQAAGLGLGLGLGGGNIYSSSGIGMGIPIHTSSSSTNYNNNNNNNNIMLQQLAPNHGHHPLNYLSGHHEPGAVVATGGVNMMSNNNNHLLGDGFGGGSWMGLPLPLPPPQQQQQNPLSGRIQDSMAATKPPSSFLRSSWN